MDTAINREVGRAKRERLLGENPVCVLYGYSNPNALLPGFRTLFESHHPFGRGNEAAVTVILCIRCHKEQTETIRDEGISMRKPPSFPETLVTILRCLKIFFRSLAEACGRWAEELANWIKGQCRSGTRSK